MEDAAQAAPTVAALPLVIIRFLLTLRVREAQRANFWDADLREGHPSQIGSTQSGLGCNLHQCPNWHRATLSEHKRSP